MRVEPQDLIEIPEHAGLPEMEIGMPPDEGEPGELPLGPGDPVAIPGTSAPATPARGHIAYLSFPIPLPVYVLYTAWWQARQEDEQHRLEAMKESDRFGEFLYAGLGRDADADADRPEEQREYDFAAFFGATFRGLTRAYHRREEQARFRQRMALARDSIAQRARDLFSMEDDDIAALLGPTGEDA